MGVSISKVHLARGGGDENGDDYFQTLRPHVTFVAVESWHHPPRAGPAHLTCDGSRWTKIDRALCAVCVTSICGPHRAKNSLGGQNTSGGG